MNKRILPDVALQKTNINTQFLDFVGMSGVSIPMHLVTKHQSQKQPLSINCRVQVGVNLQTDDKGIHMSRIYNLLNTHLSKQILDLNLIDNTLRQILHTHEQLSDYAQIHFAFEYLKRQPSLISNHSGWRTYPVDLYAHLNQNKLTLELNVGVMYSSTCPCSAALSRQLIQEKFLHDFKDHTNLDTQTLLQWLGKEENTCATPHSQRSMASIHLYIDDTQHLSLECIDDIIEDVEHTLGTAVQTSVRREDEQEFARLNAQNLMFCEDSARKLKHLFFHYDKLNIAHYHIRVEHYESLHEHDAVAEFYG